MPYKYTEKRREYHRQYNRRRWCNDPEYRNRILKNGEKWRINNKDKRCIINRRDYKKIRDFIHNVLDKHNGIKCVYCGSIEGLELDHIEGDGKTEKMRIRNFHR